MPFFNYLPAYELNRSPRIIAAFDTDFLRNLDAFRRSLPSGKAFTILLQTGWSVLVPKFATELIERMAEARQMFPEARIIFLVNEKEAIPILKDSAECVWCHQNAFLDPRRYPLATAKRRFDAIYVARITPFKRHDLASQVQNLYLIGSRSSREEEYFQTIMRTVPHVRWDEKVNSWLIGRKMIQATCGLALSSTEGSMFVCGEYSLCGLPVVNTANIGGRDLMLPGFAAFKADDTPESVAEGVEHWKAHPVPPQEIREAFLRIAAEHRACLEDLLASIAGKRVKIPHKLGIRCRLLPHQKLLHGLRQRG
ncbi:MAG: glycosyltransferase [Kiritimatiellae bacterium]|nr:glycosyltransferase [Kiritimatiellia bacterium]